MNTVPRTPVARQATDEGRTPEPTRPARWGDFLILPENRAAARAGRAVAKAVTVGRRPPFNPLVLHGPPGTGKTHLSATLLRALADGAAGAPGRGGPAGGPGGACRPATWPGPVRRRRRGSPTPTCSPATCWCSRTCST